MPQRNPSHSVELKTAPILQGALTLLIAVSVLQGCTTNVVRQTSKQDRDPEGSYDGLWNVKFERTPQAQQLPGNWLIECARKTGGFPVSVQDSRAEMNYGGNLYETYVSKRGLFKFEIPISSTAKHSNIPDGRSNITLMVGGSLKALDGKATWSIAEFNGGCTTSFSIENATED